MEYGLMEITDRSSAMQAAAAAAGRPVTAEPLNKTEGRQDLPDTQRIIAAVQMKSPPKVAEFETKDIDKAIEDLKSFVDKLGRDLDFVSDEKIDRSIIKVMDSQTNSLVRQIPSEEVVSIAREIANTLEKVRAGMFLEDKV